MTKQVYSKNDGDCRRCSNACRNLQTCIARWKMPSKRSQMGQNTPGALTWMSLGPGNNAENALMVKLSVLECALLFNPQRSNSTRGIALNLT
jgi:hypothetical protein